MLPPIDWLILNTGGSLTTEKGGSGGCFEETMMAAAHEFEATFGARIV